MTTASRPAQSIDDEADLHRPPTAPPRSILGVPWRPFPRNILFLPHPKSRGGIAYLSALVLTTTLSATEIGGILRRRSHERVTLVDP